MNIYEANKHKGFKLPKIVRLDWLIDCMMLGSVKEAQEYIIDVSKVKWAK